MHICSSKGVVGATSVGLLFVFASPAMADGIVRSAGYGLQQALNASMVAALYSLLAVAYALLHGITNRIVLSFGDIATFGAFYTVYLMLLSLSSGTATAAALGLAFLAAVLGTAALSVAVNHGIFAPLVKTPSQAIMIASIGLSILLQEAVARTDLPRGALPVRLRRLCSQHHRHAGAHPGLERDADSRSLFSA
jgi:branched-chain amino acid transport system permease protein